MNNDKCREFPPCVINIVQRSALTSLHHNQYILSLSRYIYIAFSHWSFKGSNKHLDVICDTTPTYVYQCRSFMVVRLSHISLGWACYGSGSGTRGAWWDGGTSENTPGTWETNGKVIPNHPFLIGVMFHLGAWWDPKRQFKIFKVKGRF